MVVLGISISFVLGGLAAIFSAQLGWLSLAAIPGLIFGIAILISPIFGLSTFIFIIFIQLSYVINNYHSGIPAPGIPFLAVLLFLIIWRIVIYGDRPSGWKKASIIFLVIGSWLISVIVADDFTHAILSFQKFLENAVLAFVVIFFIKDKSDLKFVIWALMLAGAFMASISVFQNLTSTFDNFYWGYGGWIEATTGGISNHRMTGPYGNPNAYAQALVVIVPLALDRLWHERKVHYRFLAGYTLVVSALTIFFTYSRNGFVTLILTVSFLFIMRRPKFVSLAITLLLGVILIQFLPVSYEERISTLFQFSSGSTTKVADESFRGRISENIAAWMMFKDNPLFGVGLDNFQVNYQEYSRQIGLDSRREERSPASFYLELLSEQGLVGALMFMVFIGLVMRGLWISYKRYLSLNLNENGHMTLAFMAGLIGYMVFYVSKNSAYSNVFWILLGIAISIAQTAENIIYSSNHLGYGTKAK